MCYLYRYIHYDFKWLSLIKWLIRNEIKKSFYHDCFYLILNSFKGNFL